MSDGLELDRGVLSKHTTALINKWSHDSYRKIYRRKPTGENFAATVGNLLGSRLARNLYLEILKEAAKVLPLTFEPKDVTLKESSNYGEGLL